jgi:hypothetical protein
MYAIATPTKKITTMVLAIGRGMPALYQRIKNPAGRRLRFHTPIIPRRGRLEQGNLIEA